MLNKVILMGRLTADPLLKFTPNGIKTATVSLAVDRNYADKDGNRGVDFINVVAWRGTAEFLTGYFCKGKLLAVEGSIQTRSYTDKQGNKRTAFEVVAEQVYFADSKTGRDKVQDELPPSAPSIYTGEFDPSQFEEVDTPDGELPF